MTIHDKERCLVGVIGSGVGLVPVFTVSQFTLHSWGQIFTTL